MAIITDAMKARSATITVSSMMTAVVMTPPDAVAVSMVTGGGVSSVRTMAPSAIQ